MIQNKNIPDTFRPFLASLLGDHPMPPPDVTSKEWHTLMDTLRLHWIAPLVYWHISRLPAEFHPPAEITGRMRNSFLASALQSLQRNKQLREIVIALNREGIEHIVLKGPALSHTVYPHPATRPYSDIDLLVRPEHVQRARYELKGLGYQCIWERHSEVTKDLYKDEQFMPGLALKSHTEVELHWGFDLFSSSLRGIDTAPLFTRAREIRTEDMSFKAMSPVDTLAYAAIHMGNHRNDPVMRLIWVYDIALLARELKGPDDWKALQEISVLWKGITAVKEALKEAVDWAGTELPPPFDDFSRWPQPAERESLVLFNRHYHSSATIEHFFQTIRSSPLPFLTKVQSFVNLLFPPAAQIKLTYAPSHPLLLPLSYIRRWLHWTRKMVRIRQDS